LVERAVRAEGQFIAGHFCLIRGNALTDGLHTVKVIATDLAGNSSAPVQQEFIFRNQAVAVNASLIDSGGGNYDIATSFNALTIAEITAVSLNGIDLDAAQQQAFFDADAITPFDLDAIGIASDTPGYNPVIILVKADIDDGAAGTVQISISDSVSWYVNDGAPEISAISPVAGSVFFTDADTVSLNEFSFSYFDRAPGVDLAGIIVSIPDKDNPGSYLDVTSRFDLTAAGKEVMISRAGAHLFFVTQTNPITYV